MMSMLIKYGRNLLLALLIAAMLVTGSGFLNQIYGDYTENTEGDADIVVRVGEYGNEDSVKAGKRYNWGKDINISQHGLTSKDIPNDIPLRKEDDSFFISEFDINMKTAKAIAKKLDEKGVKVDLQYATKKNQDLNSAGRTASKKDPRIYMSIHHNSYREDSKGYFFMTNEGDVNSSKVARRLSDSMKENGRVPQAENRRNVNGYIGEMNHVAKSGRISILGELGFFSNPEELKQIMSDEYVDYISIKIADELYNTLENMDKESSSLLQDTYDMIAQKRLLYNYAY